ncbi:alpha/beta fold hydrolase [Salinibaculum rarum]|uniref:alpha/beta fold hydrolase n=1 Tax=Salinibaculum rarum TaxID=3058903 RepID=UPI00265F7278|nr:alpha/beta hydrolase [Salinibaculum sp. KK48]
MSDDTTDPRPDPNPTEPGHPDDPARWRHETAYLSDVDLHYVTVDANQEAVDHPTGDAPLVVLLHGFPEFWYAWRHQLDAIADAGYRVVAPDLRGYNRSGKPDGVDSYAPERLVGDVRELVEHLGYAQADVVGHDWGGAIAWETAIREPDLVRRLAVLNAPHPGAYQRLLTESPEQLLKSWYVFFFQVPWLPERMLQVDDYRIVEEMLTETAAPGSFTERDVQRYKDAMARSGDLSGPVNYYRAIARENAREQLIAFLPDAVTRDTTVDVPTLVIWGEQDQALSVDLLDDLDEWVSDLRIQRLPDASHWVQSDAPDEVNELLVEFLA